ncbi:MFS transporter [Streptosporangium sp. NPDC051022]|uniref:MFS transporter n=1 Tax=Streptosporangium sp. NPDC051022 TaxID=3155752 RepID=UPI0034155603
MTTIVPVRLVRDHATWLLYLQLGVFTTYLYGLSAALPLLRIEQGVSQTVAGLHGTMMAVGGVLTGLMLPWLTRRVGRRAATWTGLAGMNVGVLLVVLGDALPVTLLGYGIASGMGSVSLYTGMSVLSDHHGPAGPAAISEANAVGGTIGLGAPFVVSLAAQSALGWRAALLVTPVLTVLLALLLGRTWVPERGTTAPGLDRHGTDRRDDRPDVDRQGDAASDRAGNGAGDGVGDGVGDREGDREGDGANGSAGGRMDGHTDGRAGGGVGDGAAAGTGTGLGRRFYLAGAVLFCCVALEFSFNLWAAKLVTDRTGLSAAVAATALTAFTAGLAVGRFGGARLALRIPPSPLLVGALGLTAAGWLLFWTSTTPVLSYAGLVLSGVGVSLHFPLALSRVLTSASVRPERATAASSLFSSTAVGAGPFALGALADLFGTWQAFLMAPVLIGLAVCGILISPR